MKALQNAIRGSVDPVFITQEAASILQASGVPYVKDRSAHIKGCQVDTQFFVDHTELLRIISGLPDWRLGELLEGYEFIAFVCHPPEEKKQHAQVPVDTN